MNFQAIQVFDAEYLYTNKTSKCPQTQGIKFNFTSIFINLAQLLINANPRQSNSIITFLFNYMVHCNVKGFKYLHIILICNAKSLADLMNQ